MCQPNSISLLVLSLGSFAGCTSYSKVTGHKQDLGFKTYMMVHVGIFSWGGGVTFGSDILFFYPSAPLCE